VFNRRIFFGGAAAAAVLASSAFTAGTALASTTPQLSSPASSLLQTGPAAAMPGLAGIFQVVPSKSLTSASPASPSVGQVSSTPRTAGMLPSAKRGRSISDPATKASGVTSGSSSLPDLSKASAPSQASSIIPALGGLSKAPSSNGNNVELNGASLPTGG
jgi:hypothetical protein